MPKIYYNLVVKKEKTFEEVPQELQEAVRKLLIDNGYEYLI